MIFRISKSFKRRIIRFIQKCILNINHLNENKRLLRNPPLHYFEYIKHAGVFSSQGLDPFNILNEWGKSDTLWNSGMYFEAVSIRRELLHEVYNYHNVNTPGYFPPAVSMGFTGPIGHVGILGVHYRAQELEIIPQGSRIVPILNEKAKREVTKSILRKYHPMYFQSGAAWGEFPSNWHVAERLQMIRSQSNFLDLYELLEMTYSEKVVDLDNPIVQLDEGYIERAASQLAAYGLPKNSWFVTLHIRSEGPNYLRRNQPSQSYVDAIKHITNLGGWVIRIGDSTMEAFPELMNFIDLSQMQGSEHLHSYVMANGKFFIGTTSGPSLVAPLFGVPSLMTNATSIARNALTMSKNSFFLPKHIQTGRRKWTFEQILNHKEGYAEDDFKPNERNYQFVCNSSSEILNAVVEMFGKLESQPDINRSQMDIQIGNIRRNAKAIGQGEISSSFISNLDFDYLSQ